MEIFHLISQKVLAFRHWLVCYFLDLQLLVAESLSLLVVDLGLALGLVDLGHEDL